MAERQLPGAGRSRRILKALAVAAIMVGATLAGALAPSRATNNDVIIDLTPILRDQPPRIVTPSTDCPDGMVYNSRLERCVEVRSEPEECPRGTEWSARQQRCVEIRVAEPEECPRGTEWSRRQERCVEIRDDVLVCEFPTELRGNRCVCVDGYEFRNGRCRREVADEPPRRTTPAEPGVDIARVQKCLNDLGFDAGPVDGASGRRTRTAFREFQTTNGLAERPDRLSDEQSLNALFDLCATPRQVAEPTPEGPVSPVADNRCLPADLYDLLRDTYGERAGVQRCANACLPKPAFLSEAQLADYTAREGVDWCDACIQLGTWLPLTAVLEIERAAKVTLCASPPLACFLPGRTVVETHREVRTIFQALPISVGNEGDIAVIVGNESYGNNLPANYNGYSDADAVKALLTGKLGYRPENIIDLRDASLADFERVFGSAENPGGELKARLTNPADSDLFIYVASHGLVGPTDQAGYILPVDARTDDLPGTALPLQQLYAALGKVGARTTMLVLEASFNKSLIELVNPPNLPQTDVVSMPETPVPGLAVFKASDRDQHTLEDPEYGIGLFTRYLIAGLAGEADNAPIGNGDKRIDTVELFVYTADMVRMAARKSFGMEQKPLLSKIDNLVIGQLARN